MTIDEEAMLELRGHSEGPHATMMDVYRVSRLFGADMPTAYKNALVARIRELEAEIARPKRRIPWVIEGRRPTREEVGTVDAHNGCWLVAGLVTDYGNVGPFVATPHAVEDRVEAYHYFERMALWLSVDGQRAPGEKWTAIGADGLPVMVEE